jgi:hypothetical protein
MIQTLNFEAQEEARVTALEASICINICKNRAFKQKPQNILNHS